MTGPAAVASELSRPEAEAIAHGRHGDPFKVLGPRDISTGRAIRTFLPGAQSVEVLRRNDRTVIGKLSPQEPEGFFEGTVVDRAHPDGVRYSVDNIRFLGQYGRGYEAIETLFPAAAGYTENDLGGSRNGALRQRRTGELDVRGSTVQTQFGGDLSILGPGGRILVGSASAPPFAPATATTVGPGAARPGRSACRTPG